MSFILSDIELQRLNTLDSKEIVQYLLEGKNELSSIQLIKLSNYFGNIDLTQALELAQLSYDRDEKMHGSIM